MTLGLSGLAGSLPYWSVDSLPEMDEGPRYYRVKYRLGLDNTTDWGPLTIRLEGVGGKDSALSQPFVFGYYGEARYAVTRWLEPMLAYDGYHTYEGSDRTLSVGLNYYPPDISAFEIQTALQRNYLNTTTQDMEDWNVIAQVVVRF